ncbi:MAG: indole-3-glycerol phosphate synthase TrpC [Chitinophagaceae bacterium]|nr:MAG: indole-3-glycerol phosphate synthase TrpC [Chitinophagaceae bacterium]
MNILDTIIANKIKEVTTSKAAVPERELQQFLSFRRPCLSLKQNLLRENSTGIIAEFKRKSPSKGFINQYANAEKITKEYSNHGASGLSVLTDAPFFGGSAEDLIAARVNDIPILRKDFVIDAYQLTEAKAWGADVILLIAACLSKKEVKDLAGFAHQLGMEVLLELHEADELGHICNDIDLVGINNRNLKTFEVDIQQSILLSKAIPAGKLKVAESGITHPATIAEFRSAGYKGFLIGEHFMKEKDPGIAFQDFVRKLQ